MFFRSGLFENTRLRELVARYVDQAMLTAIAAEHAKGRGLFVVTTNLDTQRTVIWDMGRIAEIESPEALRLFTNLNLTLGAYASQGKPVLALIDSDSYRVDAYFEETKIPQVKPGSSVKIRLMNRSAILKGEVERTLEAVNPTFTWVGLAQRIPVRIRLADIPADVLISAGMTCTVILKDGAERHIGKAIKQLISALF